MQAAGLEMPVEDVSVGLRYEDTSTYRVICDFHDSMSSVYVNLCSKYSLGLTTYVRRGLRSTSLECVLQDHHEIVSEVETAKTEKLHQGSAQWRPALLTSFQGPRRRPAVRQRWLPALVSDEILLAVFAS